jgi:acyl-CoA reductase-like NAD-dependent aldehyde dehydrogenase
VGGLGGLGWQCWVTMRWVATLSIQSDGRCGQSTIESLVVESLVVLWFFKPMQALTPTEPPSGHQPGPRSPASLAGATTPYATLLSAKVLIEGQLKSSRGPTFDIINPATEKLLGQGAIATAAEIDQAIGAANRSQPIWWQLSALERAERLHEVARQLKIMQPALAELMTREMGKPYKESADEVAWSITAIDYYAEIARHDAGNVYGPAVAGQLHYSIKEPLGTVVSILPFNYPILLFAWQAGAALAAGNAVIVKPSETTTMTTLLLMDAFTSLPCGLVQCLPGDATVGAHLTQSPDTHMVAFTGGVAAGQAVATACAPQFKRTLIEASGNDPFIVMPSAPVEIAARGAAFAAFLNCGQVCTSAERFYVHTDIYDQFVALLVQEARKLRIGNGLDRVDIGPMATQPTRERFEAMIQRAIAQGAKVACGGQRPAALPQGWFYEPTVLVDVTPDMDIVNNEPYGPVAPIVRVASFEEAIMLANRSKYGLGANIYTLRLDEAMKATNSLQAGMVWVNAPLLDNDAGPFGGRKMTGLGRELGAEGLDNFRHTKLIMIDPEAQPQDFWWFPYPDAEAYGAEKFGAKHL